MTEQVPEALPSEEPRAPREAAPAIADPRSAMTPRFNLLFRWFAKRFFRHLDLDPASLARLRELESRGSVVYVMRYASRLDYFLCNALFARHGLRLSAFANGISFYYYRPVAEALRSYVARRRLWGRARRIADRQWARRKAREVARAGESMFLFLRTERLRGLLRGRRAAVVHGRRELDLLAEITRSVWDGDREVHLVPVALFWRKGPRSARRFLNLSYGTPTRPGDIAKVTSFLLNYRDMAIRLGDPIDLRAFVADRRAEGERSVVRKVRRSILLFLYREERVVEGPALQSRQRVQEMVLADPGVAAAVAQRAEERNLSRGAAHLQAEKVFREIAANMNSTVLALLYALVSGVMRRLFRRIESRGLETVAAYAKQHPLVLMPSHRSYFDFLILSCLFYENHLVPPHIAARENMAFGPFGFLFRRCGAFFLRRSFDDSLYKAVFRSYVGYLVREGFTQEFFIEGGRSRTGKSLAPRLGILSWNVQGFIDSGRKDLFFVPVAIAYERLVEEGAMVSELEGGEKQQESVLGLMRARKLLKRRFGSVFVNFGEPISLAQALSGRRELFLGESSAERDASRRTFTEALGNEIVERINWAMVATTTSVAACALLGAERRGYLRSELTAQMRDVTDLLRLQDVRLTPELEGDPGDFRDAIAFLLRSGLIRTQADPRGEILYYEKNAVRALSVYRNMLFHFLVAPSLMARRLLRGASAAELRGDVEFWLDLLYREFFVPRALVRAVHVDAFLDYFERIGALERLDDRFRATEKGVVYFGFLAEQTRSLLEVYHAIFASMLALDAPRTTRQLEKAAQEQFERGVLLGEVRRAEGWSPVTFGNALDLLERRGILELETSAGREPGHRRGPAFDALRGLVERLAGALAGG